MAHEFVLLDKNERQRFYQLPYKCNVFPACKNIQELLTKNPPDFREGITIDDSFENGIDKVCISDAKYHIERLVFPAFYVLVDSERILTTSFDRLSGQMTFMIDGGEIETIRDDLVYLRQIMMMNRGNHG